MFTQLSAWSMVLLQQEVGFDMISMWNQMGFGARAVVIIMFLMSAWSIGVMIDRWIAFNAARKQSRQYAPAVAGALREGKLEEAVKVSERYKKSHLAKVVVAGLQEFNAHQMSAEIPGETIESSQRALERAQADRSRRVKPRLKWSGYDRFDRPVRRVVRHRYRHH